MKKVTVLPVISLPLVVEAKNIVFCVCSLSGLFV